MVQPVLPRSTTSSIRMARRKTWPEGVAGRRGRKAWSEDVVGRRGRKTWSESVVGRRACRNRRTFFKWQCVDGKNCWSVGSCGPGPQAVETVDSPWIAARSFGVQLHDSDPAYRRGFGADPQPSELGEGQGLHQHCDLQHRSLRLHHWQACQRGLQHV